MAEGRMRHDWDIGSLLWVTLAEPNRDKNKRPKPFTIFDVHPYRKDSKSEVLSIDQAKAMFPKCRADAR